MTTNTHTHTDSETGEKPKSQAKRTKHTQVAVHCSVTHDNRTISPNTDVHTATRTHMRSLTHPIHAHTDTPHHIRGALSGTSAGGATESARRPERDGARRGKNTHTHTAAAERLLSKNGRSAGDGWRASETTLTRLGQSESERRKITRKMADSLY